MAQGMTVQGRSTPYTREQLYAPGPSRVYEGPTATCVAFPLGGIGTGSVSLGGRGELRDWEIFNSPNKERILPFTFVALRAARRGEDPVQVVLERRFSPPYTGWIGAAGSATERHSVPRGLVPGLPRLESCRFTGEFPLARAEFSDRRLPVIASLEAFSPFIPMNESDSSLPVAILTYRLHNPGNTRVAFTLVATLLNAIGYIGPEFLIDWNHQCFGANLNEFLQEPGLCGLRMTSSRYPPEDPRYGSMAMVSPWHEDTTYLTHWARQNWTHEDLNLFWDDLAVDGRLDEDVVTTGPTPIGRTDVGSLGLCGELAPGEEAELPIILTWHFPNRRNNWTGAKESGCGCQVGNWYTQQHRDAWGVAEYVVANFHRLRSETLAFHGTLFDTTLPAHVVEAISSQLSTLHTNTVFRNTDGHVLGFEGCGEITGCCPMNCTHVWNYAQSMAFLFPALERDMRETDFLLNTDVSGNMAFRTLVPLGPRWQFKPAADGQMGSIMRVYRDWQICGDNAWLAKLWPAVRRALAFAWQFWDADQDGVMEGEQHTTYDIELYGPNTMTGAWYLGALRAAEEMAHALGEPEPAAGYRALYEQGRRLYDELCWNGEYYVQRVPPIEEVRRLAQEGDSILGTAFRPGEHEPRYQYGSGCLSNQLVGQFAATVCGLGYLLPAEHVREALQAVFRYNWRTEFYSQASYERVFSLNDDAGVVDCSWPQGGRPRLSFPSADGTLTGYEYQLACLLLYEGFFDEGLTIIHAVRDRHDGQRRNPWNEFECGDHYCRAMANWAALLALSGYHYSAPRRYLRLAPRLEPRSFKSFWSAGGAWGTFKQSVDAHQQIDMLSVRYGELSLRALELAWCDGVPERLDVQMQLDGADLKVELQVTGTALIVAFPQGVDLMAGQSLVATFMARDDIAVASGKGRPK